MTIFWTDVDDSQPGTDRPVIAWGRVCAASGLTFIGSINMVEMIR